MRLSRWRLRRVGETAWRDAQVPGCWEQAGIAPDDPGPVEYRTTLRAPGAEPGRSAVWLRFGAVGYACQVFLDGHRVGGHLGMWDPFEVDLTEWVTPGGGRDHELLVVVEKPAGLTAGPNSPHVPGRYPTRETFSGFLPYVSGHIFGGLWQDVSVLATGPVRIRDVHAHGTPDGRLSVTVEPSGAAPVHVTVTDPDGVLVAAREQDSGGAAESTLDFTLPDPRPWSPHSPALYTVTVAVPGERRTVRVGLRELAADGTALRLNGDPLFPRLALSWGWYPDVPHGNPGPERVRADLLALRSLGFNGVKLCLWFPPEYYFDIADELGMLLWVELPMWLPRPTAAFRRQLFAESRRLVAVARNHPSVILYTLGCELSSAVGADVLGPLHELVSGMVRDALVRDNSGSGEAYGGLLDEYADFDDHHFYCEPQFFRGVLDYFAPGARPARPWLFGEFGDYDAFRDLRRLSPRPWWASADPAVNPQGARWQYDVQQHEETLRRNGFWERGSELERASAEQALLHRKLTLETVRARTDTSGYVITGERDTPISTAGLIDDHGALRVDPARFAGFNADLVLTVGFDRRRAWVAGGDRPAYWDTWCYPAGAVVRPHLVLAHHGRTAGAAELSWTVGFDGAEPFATGTSTVDVVPGTVRELTVARFEAPAVDRPRRATLRAALTAGEESTVNSWPLWFLPGSGWTATAPPMALVDPLGRLADLAGLAGLAGLGEAGPGRVVVSTAWTPALRDHLDGGGPAILLLDTGTAGNPYPVLPMPFWREAVKVCEPHPAWGDFPHDGFTDLQFAGCAPDCALDLSDAAGVRPILRRVDTRTAEVHDYAAEVRRGAGRLIVSTLRFQGGAGDQPLGVARNTGAAYLLSRWVRALSADAGTGGSPRAGDRAPG